LPLQFPFQLVGNLALPIVASQFPKTRDLVRTKMPFYDKAKAHFGAALVSLEFLRGHHKHALQSTGLPASPEIA